MNVMLSSDTASDPIENSTCLREGNDAIQAGKSDSVAGVNEYGVFMSSTRMVTFSRDRHDVPPECSHALVAMVPSFPGNCIESVRDLVRDEWKCRAIEAIAWSMSRKSPKENLTLGYRMEIYVKLTNASEWSRK